MRDCACLAGQEAGMNEKQFEATMSPDADPSRRQPPGRKHAVPDHFPETVEGRHRMKWQTIKLRQNLLTVPNLISAADPPRSAQCGQFHAPCRHHVLRRSPGITQHRSKWARFGHPPHSARMSATAGSCRSPGRTRTGAQRTFRTFSSRKVANPNGPKRTFNAHQIIGFGATATNTSLLQRQNVESQCQHSGFHQVFCTNPWMDFFWKSLCHEQVTPNWHH